MSVLLILLGYLTLILCSVIISGRTLKDEAILLWAKGKIAWNKVVKAFNNGKEGKGVDEE